VYQLIITREGQDLCDGLLRDTKLAVYIACMVTPAVAQLVEALRYKPEGRGFDSRLCHWNFSFLPGRTMTLGSTQPIRDMSTRNISWGVKAAGYLEIGESYPPGTLRACPGL
jgi:hypothetical protein